MNWYNVLKATTRIELEANWTRQAPLKGTSREIDFVPVTKLFLPWCSGTWLLTELEPGTPLAFGLCDLGFGTPELGYVDLSELAAVSGPGGLHVEEDRHFKPSKTLSQYSADAARIGCIVV